MSSISASSGTLGSTGLSSFRARGGSGQVVVVFKDAGGGHEVKIELNLAMVLRTTRLKKLTVVFKYYEAKETYSRI